MSGALALEPPRAAPRLSAAARQLQKACACGGKAPGHDECEACAVQRKERHGTPRGDVASPEVATVMTTPGQPLASAVRDDMEQRFAADFSRVRIHDDATAARAADAVDARAFTLGDHIAFAAGTYDPVSDSGRHLLAHELAHTIQQARGGSVVQGDGGPGEPALEREADAAADAVLAWRAPPPLTPASGRIARKPGGGGQAAPQPSRGAKSVTLTAGTPPLSYVVSLVSAPTSIANVEAPLVTVEVDKFYLPGTKGIRAFQAYKTAPLAPLISVPKDKASRVSLKQDREATTDLRDNWLQRVNWARDQAATLWQAAGGDATFPSAGGKVCHMDHVVELQLGGSGQPVNIQALDAAPNMDSGRRIRANLADLAGAIADSDALGLGSAVGDIQLRIRFKDVAKDGEPQATPCQQVETVALGGSAPKDATRELKKGRKLYPLQMPEGPTDFSVDSTLAAQIEADDDNNALRLAMKGLILTRLDRPVRGRNPLNARLDLETSRLPLKDTSKAKQGVILFDASKDAVPKLRQNKTNVPIELLYLSPGKITEIEPSASGVNWRGEVNPTHKFLPKLGIAYTDGTLAITSGLSEDALKKASPFPGAKITKAEIGIQLMPSFEPKGRLEFEIAPGGRKVMAATVDLLADDGLAADGTVDLFIPGVKSATGKASYRRGQWSMSAKVETKDLTLPYLRDGALTAHYQAGAFGAEGQINLSLPGNGTGTLGLGYQGGKWIFSGRGAIGHPKFGDIKVFIRDDGDEFTAFGEAKTQFPRLGLTPKLTVTYRQKRSASEPTITGTGSVAIDRPRLSGNLAVTLGASGRFAAKGEATYQIRPDLAATLGMEIDEAEHVRVTGEARLTKPIDLFPRKGGAHNIKLFKLAVPIPGASIGPIGLKFGVEAGIKASYGVGPAQLRDVMIGGKINPFDADPDPVLDFKGTLAVSANADLGLWLSGSLIADAGLADAKGSLTVGAGIEAKGEASLATQAHYEKSAFAISATARAGATLDLRFTLDAGVTIETFLGDYGPGATWTWRLGQILVPTGLGFAFEAPVAWDSTNGLALPRPDQIKWEPPRAIDAGDLLGRIFAAATARQPEKDAG